MDPESPENETIANNVHIVLEKIATLSRLSGREPDAVSLVAVTKTQAWPACASAISAGAVIIGENRLQEALAKFPKDIHTRHPGLELHFIGHLQKNKAKKAVGLFSCIQSIDDLGTLQIVSQEASLQGKTIDIFFEMNTSGENSKNGCTSPEALFQLLESALTLPAINLRGLMTIGPLGNDETQIRSAFAQLRELALACQARFAPPAWGCLSMGMSNDYALAIGEGATHVRIGTALFGPRLVKVPGANA